MRTRNIKINVFLNEEEKRILINKSNKANLSQSDFFRMLIKCYSENKILNKDMDESILYLTNISDELSNLSNKLNRLCYYDFVNLLENQISIIKKVINKIQN